MTRAVRVLLAVVGLLALTAGCSTDGVQQGDTTCAKESPAEGITVIGSDYIHATPRGGHCHIRVYLPGEERDGAVICTEMANNPSTPITNVVRRIAAEAIEAHLLPTPLGTA